MYWVTPLSTRQEPLAHLPLDAPVPVPLDEEPDELDYQSDVTSGSEWLSAILKSSSGVYAVRARSSTAEKCAR